MRPSRAWIYVGLGAAATVGLAQLFRGPTLRAGDRVLLVSSDLGSGLAVPLGTLCKEGKVAFQALTASASIAPALAAFQPTVVILSTDPGDPGLPPLVAQCELVKPRAIVWVAQVVRPGPAPSELPKIIRARVSVFPSHRLTLPRGPDGIHPVASGYAQWAGALWQWLT